MSDPQTPLQWALRYREHGYSVIPVHTIEADGLCSCNRPDAPSPGKHPRLNTWTRFQQERATEAQIRTWWAQWPKANIGIVTGAVSGIVVIDIDPKHGGNALDLNIDLNTVTALTGGGGQHLYYAHPGGLVGNRGGMFPGVDLRGDGGFVVAPPSNHESGGSYLWEVGYAPWEAALLPFPETINRLDPIKEVNLRPNFAAEIDHAMKHGIPVGQRNVFLTRVAGYYLSRGKDFQETLNYLVALNVQASQADERGQLSLAELTTITKSIYERDQKQRTLRETLNILQQTEISMLSPTEKLEYAKSAWAEINVEGVTDWYKSISVGGGVEYILEQTDRTCPLGEDLLAMQTIRTKIFNFLNVGLPALKRAEWDAQMFKLGALAREERTGAMTITERVADWMSEYLQDAREVDEELRVEALRNGRSARPILIDGIPYLRAAHFQGFLEGRMGEKTTAKQTANWLRQGGYEITTLGNERIRVWRGSTE